MAEYGVVFKKIWNSPRFFNMTENAQRLVLYSFSSPHSNMIGTYFLKEQYACGDLRWSVKKFRAAISEAEKNNWLEYSREDEVMLIKGWFTGYPAAHRIENENQCKKALSEITELPRCPLIGKLIDEIIGGSKGIPNKDLLKRIVEGSIKRLPEELAEPFHKRFAERFGNPETETETVTETTPETGKENGGVYTPPQEEGEHKF